MDINQSGRAEEEEEGLEEENGEQGGEEKRGADVDLLRGARTRGASTSKYERRRETPSIFSPVRPVGASCFARLFVLQDSPPVRRADQGTGASRGLTPIFLTLRHGL